MLSGERLDMGHPFCWYRNWQRPHDFLFRYGGPVSDCLVLGSAQHLHQFFQAILPRNYLNKLSKDSISYPIPVVNPFFLKPITIDSVV